MRRAMALRGAALALAGRTPSMHAAQRTSPEVVLGGGEQQRLDLAQHQLRMHAWALQREHSVCARTFACALRVRRARARSRAASAFASRTCPATESRSIPTAAVTGNVRCALCIAEARPRSLLVRVGKLATLRFSLKAQWFSGKGQPNGSGPLRERSVHQLGHLGQHR